MPFTFRTHAVQANRAADGTAGEIPAHSIDEADIANPHAGTNPIVCNVAAVPTSTVPSQMCVADWVLKHAYACNKSIAGVMPWLSLSQLASFRFSDEYQ